MYCTNCGQKLPDDAAFCTKCGAKCGAKVTGPAAESRSETISKAPNTVPPVYQNVNEKKGINKNLIGTLVVLLVLIGGIFAYMYTSPIKRGDYFARVKFFRGNPVRVEKNLVVFQDAPSLIVDLYEYPDITIITEPEDGSKGLNRVHGFVPVGQYMIGDVTDIYKEMAKVYGEEQILDKVRMVAFKSPIQQNREIPLKIQANNIKLTSKPTSTNNNSSAQNQASPNPSVPAQNPTTANQAKADPISAFQSFHEAITRKDFKTAYNILGSDMQKYIGTYEKFVQGYATTLSSTVTDAHVVTSDSSNAVIEYMLEAKDQLQTGLSIQHFKGKANLQKTDGEWKIIENRAQKVEISSNRPNLGAPPVAGNAIAGATHSSADVEGSYIHSAALTIDNNTASCWSEGVQGLGIGEKIIINFNGVYKVSGLDIWAGHQKSKDLFYQNARPTKIRVAGSDGTSNVYFLEDQFGMQRVNLVRPIETTFISITIEQAARGSKYEDTCISEVKFF